MEECKNSKEDLVFALGYAGEHFGYYAHGTTVHTPLTLAEMLEITGEKKRVWCLITAWLPDLRPAYEDEALYAERPGQVEVYNYVKEHFALKKLFPSKYPVKIFYLHKIAQ
jgi:hypothetical protein